MDLVWRSGVLTTAIVAIAGCASYPPERQQRDLAILAAVKPCKERYAERLYNVDMMSVYPNGTVRFWYKGDLPSAADDISRCLFDHTKDLKLGPWLPGRLVKAGPATVTTTLAAKDIVISVRLNGISGRMAVRTGADFTFVSQGYARRADLRVVSESPTTNIRSAGKTVAVPYARARVLEVGDAQVEALDVVVYEALTIDPSVDGILGRSFLSLFKIDIDRVNSRITLEPLRGGG